MKVERIIFQLFLEEGSEQKERRTSGEDELSNERGQSLWVSSQPSKARRRRSKLSGQSSKVKYKR